MNESEENLVLFRQEAEELLIEMTESLLALEATEGEIDAENIHRLFRAVHTIKGLSAMCELDHVSAFAHRLEDSLAKVRGHANRWNRALTSAAFAATDVLKVLIERPAGIQDETRVTEPVLRELERLCAAALSEPEPSSGVRGPVHLHAPAAANSGTPFSSVVTELRRLGPCHAADHGEGWDFLLLTQLSDGELEEALFFLSDFRIARLHAPEGIDLSEIAERFGEQLAEIPTDEIAGFWEASIRAETPERSGAPAPAPGLKAQTQSLRVSADRLDRLVEIVGEIVVTQGRLLQLASGVADTQWAQPVEEMGRLVESLRSVTMNIRMMPVGHVFRGLNRMVRDIAAELGKEVHFITSGDETELDKTVVDKLVDPLIHLLRNSLDHGISAPEERERAGKPRRGIIHLSAAHQGSQVLITVRDDGDGIDPESVRQRAVALGLLKPDYNPPRKELMAVLFTPGFSTKAHVTELSGRGVGLDVVKRQVDALRGTVEVESHPGHGALITLRLPLTLAIIDGLLVDVGATRYVIPLASVRECLDFQSQDRPDHFTQVLQVRDEAVPFVDARHFLSSRGGTQFDVGTAVLLEQDGTRFALIVDRVLGDYQTVVKSVGPLYRTVEIVSGATVLGDGSMALILDPAALLRRIETDNAGKGRPLTPASLHSVN